MKTRLKYLKKGMNCDADKWINAYDEFLANGGEAMLELAKLHIMQTSYILSDEAAASDPSKLAQLASLVDLAGERMRSADPVDLTWVGRPHDAQQQVVAGSRVGWQVLGDEEGTLRRAAAHHHATHAVRRSRRHRPSVARAGCRPCTGPGDHRPGERHRRLSTPLGWHRSRGSGQLQHRDVERPPRGLGRGLPELTGDLDPSPRVRFQIGQPL